MQQETEFNIVTSRGEPQYLAIEQGSDLLIVLDDKEAEDMIEQLQGFIKVMREKESE